MRDDIVNGVIKSVVFGVAVSLIAVFEGYDAQPTAEGVSRATTRTVVDGVARDPRARFRADRHSCSPEASRDGSNRATIDLWVGIFVVIGIGALAVPRAQGRQPRHVRRRRNGYHVTARFDNIGGLKLRAPVKSAGVVVGRVDAHPLRPRRPTRPRCDATSTSAIKFPRDSIASILTSGLLGEQYIGLEAGRRRLMLADGDRMRMTQSAVVLENLISQFLFSKAAEGKDEKK